MNTGNRALESVLEMRYKRRRESRRLTPHMNSETSYHREWDEASSVNLVSRLKERKFSQDECELESSCYLYDQRKKQWPWCIWCLIFTISWTAFRITEEIPLAVPLRGLQRVSTGEELPWMLVYHCMVWGPGQNQKNKASWEPVFILSAFWLWVDSAPHM